MDAEPRIVHQEAGAIQLKQHSVVKLRQAEISVALADRREFWVSFELFVAGTMGERHDELQPKDFVARKVRLNEVVVCGSLDAIAISLE